MRSRVALLALLGIGLLATAHAWNPRSLLGYGSDCGSCQETKPCEEHKSPCEKDVPDSGCVIVIDDSIPKVNMGKPCGVEVDKDCPVECKDDGNVQVITPCDIQPAEEETGCHAKKLPDRFQNIWGGGKLDADDCAEIEDHVEGYVGAVLCHQKGVPEEDTKNCLESGSSCNKCEEEKPCEEHKAPCEVEEGCKPKKHPKPCKPKKHPKPCKKSPKPCPPSPCPPSPCPSPMPSPCESPEQPCVKVWAQPDICYGDVVLAEECEKKCESPKPPPCHEECHQECHEEKPCEKPCEKKMPCAADDEEEHCSIKVVTIKDTQKPPAQPCDRDWTVDGCKDDNMH